MAFRTPVTTIRDVAELTETSPKTIARILADIRGPGEVERLDARIDDHEVRIRSVEQSASTLQYKVETLRASVDEAPVRAWERRIEPSHERYASWLGEEIVTAEERNFLRTFIFASIAVIVCLVLVGIAYSNS